MGHSATSIELPAHIVDQWATLGLDLAGLFSAGSLGTRLGLRVLRAAPEEVVGILPVEGNTQPYGLLHGGASAVLAETLGSIGAMLHAGPSKIAVGVDLNCTHHRSVRTGTVTGVATPVHAGRTTATYEIVLTDERDRRVCTARLTCGLRPAVQGSPGGSSRPADSAAAPAGSAESPR